MGYCGQRSHGTRKGEYSSELCDRSTPTGPAFLVRGSSRRITIMQAGSDARSANIRVINRRSKAASTFARNAPPGGTDS